ncbi:2-amino-4-hydroxy-6-hydroxymethyldihydropteridine diphosphokinase [Actinocrinis sp.]|uniref:2-amino-4-hydroxy-6- hydroxymethyldihydropteridine diphosphokinase n=1 Tax=Actinocrinis sp. TaxID=1920516 RepID=UPI002D2BFE3C|nr:2-amino-4-hydroxy-6-hydroxymethyldihydropteridine diphosphokinase [Actinocrinis sp.]HZP51921.1 2-amino-4-hydroxy-6-hydroxymethyldihydropteridine diphosphokinase [Actinocrinis sp.]
MNRERKRGYDHRAVLALGGNLGHRLETLQAALDALVDTPALDVVAVSPVYETEPFGGPQDSADAMDLSGQPNFYNAVVLVATDLTPLTLLDRALAIEQALHRRREERWSARTIDVDIIAYDSLVTHNNRLTVPHPRAHQRAFVLVPWHDVEPDAKLPGWGPVSALLEALKPIDGVKRRDDLSLQL